MSPFLKKKKKFTLSLRFCPNTTYQTKNIELKGFWIWSLKVMFAKVAVDVYLPLLLWELGIFSPHLCCQFSLQPMELKWSCALFCVHKSKLMLVFPKSWLPFFPSALMAGKIKDFILNEKLHIVCVLTSQNCSNIITIAGRVENKLCSSFSLTALTWIL